jgi:hypothetical protein
MQQRDQEIAAVQSELSRQQQSQEALLGRMARLEAEVSALQTAPDLLSPSDALPVLQFDSISADGSESDGSESDGFRPRSATLTSAVPPPPEGWHSAIVRAFPKLFEDFEENQFTLLWRGSRDGFRARDFHNRCDGHPNTLTVILDTNGNIFGGFTPVEWESRKWNGKKGSENNCRKADPSLKSFLFTLKNPHNVPARRFALNAQRQHKAITCRSTWGPCVGDIWVHDSCNANTFSPTYRFGLIYHNDTGLDRSAFFTGSRKFQVKEIEVFEITD